MPTHKLTHRTQLFLTDEQYRWLKVRAASAGSIAAVVRDWIDAEMEVDPEALRNDPAIRYLLSDPEPATGVPSTVTTIDQDLYG
ncbi:MAG: hypothetical protein ACRDKL_07945 [Solirubrobacteraceae bacterium]